VNQLAIADQRSSAVRAWTLQLGVNSIDELAGRCGESARDHALESASTTRANVEFFATLFSQKASEPPAQK